MVTPISQAEPTRKAQEAADRALALDGSLAEAHLASAEALLYHDWNFAGAEKEFKRTLDLNPNYSTGHQWYGEFLSLLGRHDEAIREQRTALTLDPLSAVIHHQAGTTLRDAGHYDEADQQYRQALKISPDLLVAYEAMSWSFRRQGKFADSVQALQMIPAFLKGDNANPAIAGAIGALRSAYANGGRAGYFRQCLKLHGYYPRAAYYLGRDYAQLGDGDAAIRELGRSYQNHEMEALWMLGDPELDPLRSDPRFQRLIRAIGFPH
jgi:tetratricopeptide (TPR) repeat protein